MVRSGEKNFPSPRFGGRHHFDGGLRRVADGPWEKIVVECVNTSLDRLAAITISAPSARAAETGTGLTSAPSTSQRSPTRTGEKIPGSA